MRTTPPRRPSNVSISTFRIGSVPVLRVIQRASIPMYTHKNEDSHNGRRQTGPIGRARVVTRPPTGTPARGRGSWPGLLKTLLRRSSVL